MKKQPVTFQELLQWWSENDHYPEETCEYILEVLHSSNHTLGRMQSMAYALHTVLERLAQHHRTLLSKEPDKRPEIPEGNEDIEDITPPGPDPRTDLPDETL